MTYHTATAPLEVVEGRSAAADRSLHLVESPCQPSLVILGSSPTTGVPQLHLVVSQPVRPWVRPWLDGPTAA